jgi:hypothetical protein
MGFAGIDGRKDWVFSGWAFPEVFLCCDLVSRCHACRSLAFRERGGDGGSLCFLICLRLVFGIFTILLYSPFPFSITSPSLLSHRRDGAKTRRLYNIHLPFLILFYIYSLYRERFRFVVVGLAFFLYHCFSSAKMLYRRF